MGEETTGGVGSEKEPPRDLLGELGQVWARIRQPWRRVLLRAAILLPVLSLGIPLAVWACGDEHTGGTLGDSAGLANAIVSGMAFAVLVATILLQSRELELQREELSAQRTEMEGQRAALEETAQAQRLTSEALGKQLTLAERDARLRGLASVLEVYDQITTRAENRVRGITSTGTRNRELVWVRDLVKHRNALLELLEKETRALLGKYPAVPPQPPRPPDLV